jgi:hypothetical protein
MKTSRPETVAERSKTRTAQPQTSEDAAPQVLGEAEFKAHFGEGLQSIIDVDKWPTGLDWEAAVERFRTEISFAVKQEAELRDKIRDTLLPQLGRGPGDPAAGVFRARPDELAAVHGGLLFPGNVEAVDGTSVSYDSLPIGITQIGVALVSYGGSSATFAQRIYRKDIPVRSGDPLKEAISFLQKRDSEQAVDAPRAIAELTRRGIMAYAERKILLDKSDAEWRLGHGNPCPYELLTGSGHMDLLDSALEVLSRLIRDHKKFVFVPSAPRERALLTIGNALDAGEYAIIEPMHLRMMKIVEEGHYSAEYKAKAISFVNECGPDVLLGLFRVSEMAPPYIFYAHRQHVHIAARIAMADSIVRPERGFPMLIDVADVTCRSAFGADGFMGLIHDAYARSGGLLRYFGERDTRR